MFIAQLALLDKMENGEQVKGLADLGKLDFSSLRCVSSLPVSQMTQLTSFDDNSQDWNRCWLACARRRHEADGGANEPQGSDYLGAFRSALSVLLAPS